MSEESPVFRTEFEADLWKAIDRAESQKVPEKHDRQLSVVLRKVESCGEPVSSSILCRLIRIVAAVGASGWEKDIEDLVARQRPMDSHPTLTAASVMAEKGVLSVASAYLDSVHSATDVAYYARVRGEVQAACGKTSEAIHSLWQSLRSNPLDTSAYVLLQRLDPSVNWMAYCAIDRMVAGLSYDRPPAQPEGGETILYGIYEEWYHGDHNIATRRLMASVGYRESNPDFLLLSARMALDSGDVESARAMYAKASAALPDDVGVLCEAASSYLAGDNPDAQAAHVRYREAEAMDPGNFKVTRGLIRTYSALGRDAEAAEVLREFLNTEAADKSDYDMAERLFIDIGYMDDAMVSAEAVCNTYPDDVPAHITISRVHLAHGDIGSARDYAKKAVHIDRHSAEAYAQLSCVMLVMRHVATAMRLAKRAASLDSCSVPALVALMNAYRESGDLDNAIDTGRRILVIDPDNADARGVTSRAQTGRSTGGSGEIPVAGSTEDFESILKGLLNEKRYDEVETLCAENAEKFGDVAEVRRLRGNAEYANHEYVKASASFASAAVMCPDSSEIWHSKGLADEGFGDLDSALEAYDRAVLLDMSNAHYWVSRGCVLEAKGDYVAAVEAFNRAIELDRNAPYPLVRKAAILASFGRYSEALAFMDMAGGADPDNLGIREIRMRMCLEAGRYSEAASICRNLMAKDHSTGVVAALIRAEIGLGDMGSASRRLKDALAQDPRNLDLLTVARDMHVKNADQLEVVDVCRTILDIDPLDNETRLILADTLMRSGCSDEASQLYLQADEKPPETGTDDVNIDDPVALFSISRSLLQAGELIGAARNADRLLELDPDNEDYIIFRSQLYVQNGDTRVAETFLNDYMRREPDSIRVAETLGDLKASLGLYDDAVDLYTRCLSEARVAGNIGYRSRLLVKLAEVQEKMRSRPAAIRSYTEAVNLDPHDTESARALTRLLLVSGDRDTAMNVIHASLNVEESAASYAVLAQVCQSFEDVEGVRDAYRGFIRFENPDQKDVLSVVAALNSVGLVSDAEMLRGHSEGARKVMADVAEDVPPAVKRCAERLMRRAYMQGMDIKDPVIRDSTDVDSELANQAIEYLSDIPVYGDVVPGTSDYERMETLTYNVVSAPRAHNLDQVSVASAYVAGHSKDADEARMLIAYIASAKVSAIPSVVPQELHRIAQSYNGTESIEKIMRDNHCGVMTARIIQSCI